MFWSPESKDMGVTGLSEVPDICRGTSGFVQLAENTETGEVVAIKFLERGGSASQRVIARELLNHRECALHPNIVQLKVSSVLLKCSLWPVPWRQECPRPPFGRWYLGFLPSICSRHAVRNRCNRKVARLY